MIVQHGETQNERDVQQQQQQQIVHEVDGRMRGVGLRGAK